jgi:CBS domain-containing protein
MTWPVYTVRVDDPVEQAAALLAEKNITAAPVLDRDGFVVGMVSESDVLWDRVPAGDPSRSARGGRGGAGRVVERAAVPPPRYAADVMSTPLLAAGPYAEVADAAELMLDHDVRSVPVLNQTKLVGIVSRRDILRSLVRTDDIVAHDVQHRLDQYAGHDRRWTATVKDGEAAVDGEFDDEVERRTVGVLARTVPGVRAVRLG